MNTEKNSFVTVTYTFPLSKNSLEMNTQNSFITFSSVAKRCCEDFCLFCRH